MDIRRDYELYNDNELREELNRIASSEQRVSALRAASMIPQFKAELKREIESYTAMYSRLPVAAIDTPHKLAGVQAAEYALTSLLTAIENVEEHEQYLLKESKRIRDLILAREEEQKGRHSHFDREKERTM